MADHCVILKFRFEMIRIKLRSLKPDKAPGPDGIHPYLLRELANSLCHPLSILFTKRQSRIYKEYMLFTYVQYRYWLFKVQSHQHIPLLTFSSDAILLVCRSLPMPYFSDYSRSLLITSLSGYAVYIKRTFRWCDVYYSAGIHICRS